MANLIHFMSTQFNLAGHKEISAAIASANRKNPIRVATLNPEFILEANQNPAFSEALRTMNLCTIDGAGLFYFLNLYFKCKGKSIKLETVRGADLVQELLKHYQGGEKRFFLLGGAPGLSKAAKTKIETEFPGCIIAGEDDGGIIDAVHPTLNPQLSDKIQACNPDILLVGFGAPKQELWMQTASQSLTVPVMIGVGGTFGFYANKNRAPQWVRRLSLEWLYRSLTEKGHWKRAYKAVIVFPLKASLWILQDLIHRSS